MKIEKTIPMIGSANGLADLRVYNIMVYCGYVESFAHAPLIFQHSIGFADAKEALLHLHDSIVSAIKECMEDEMWNKIKCLDPENDYSPDIEEIIFRLQPSTNDDAPAGYEFWEYLSSNGWSYQGDLVTGVCVSIQESGEKILASREMIQNHCDAYEGKRIMLENHSYPVSSVLDLQILIVSKIPKKLTKN